MAMSKAGGNLARGRPARGQRVGRAVVNLTMHPDDKALLGPRGKRGRRVALALMVLRIAPPDLVDRARVMVAERDEA